MKEIYHCLYDMVWKHLVKLEEGCNTRPAKQKYAEKTQGGDASIM